LPRTPSRTNGRNCGRLRTGVRPWRFPVIQHRPPCIGL
jgi:hypothetical protein